MPRRRKSFTSRKRSHSAPAAVRLHVSRTGKRKQWSEENMLSALKAVEEGASLSIKRRGISMFLGVHYTTVLAEELPMV